MTEADCFYSRFAGRSTGDLMTALDAAGVPADQDWEAGSTTWTFADGSAIRVEGPTAQVTRPGIGLPTA